MLLNYKKQNNEELEVVQPKECELFPGYFHVPEEDNIVVSYDGKFKSYPKGKDLKVSKTSTNYYQVNVSGKGSTKAHRQLAKTFIGRPLSLKEVPFSQLEVNHKNGVRDDNSFSNLEWVTSSGNMYHAHSVLIHPLDRPVLAKSLIDDKILRFHSMRDCAKTFDVHHATLWKHLGSGNSGKSQKYDYIFKYEDDSEWNLLPRYMIRSLGEKVNIKVSVEIKRINKIYIFATLADATREFNLKFKKVWRSIKKCGEYINGEITIKSI